MAMLKIHCKASDAPAIEAVLGTQGRVVETYDSFVLADADAAGARALARRFPVENVDALYRLPLHGALLDPLVPLPRTRGVATRAAAAPDTLGPGPHHYLVQFIGPVKAAWVRALTKAGATLRHPTGGFAYVVLADDAALERLRALKAVRWVGHLPPADRIAPGLAGASAAPRTRSAGAAPSAPAQATRRRTLPGALVARSGSP